MEISRLSSSQTMMAMNTKRSNNTNQTSIEADSKSKENTIHNFKATNPKTNEATSVGELKLMEAIDKINKSIEGASRRFEYSVHDKTNTVMVKVIDSETDEIIKEIPPEKILNLVANLWEMAGIIVDESV